MGLHVHKADHNDDDAAASEHVTMNEDTRESARASSPQLTVQ
jgi:hypothetical protein